MTPPVPESPTITSERATPEHTAAREAAVPSVDAASTAAPVAQQAPRKTPDVNLSDPDFEPGASLEIEAFELLEQRRFKEAITMAGALGRLRPDDLIPDAITAVAGANLFWKRSGSVAASRLRERLLEPSALKDADDETRRRHAIGWGAMSSYFLAFHDYASADHAARHVLDIDPESSTAWWQLSASYAGLGWFEEAESCLASAQQNATYDAPPSDHTPLARWQVGRSVNHWAMTKTPALWLSVVMWIFIGLLSCAVYLTTPFLARELRVVRLEDDLRNLANEHWATDARRRTLTALAVAAVIGLWVLGLIFLTPANG